MIATHSRNHMTTERYNGDDDKLNKNLGIAMSRNVPRSYKDGHNAY